MSTSDKQDYLKAIDSALDNVRPHLKVDGGDIEVVDLADEMVVQIKWLGNCENCFMSAMTMKAGVEQELKSKFPEIKGVEALNGVKIETP